ncbi:sensor histidine kinase [Salinarimonas ramus]|uniref:histidine kinase n=1 Tax=Salinarimonas ramus TaxID=690164 RepID=A0A917Q9Q2_9HYPH|nr:histidine kinase dimerization/phosphoacceptor domain -containing protein [Salinarimonas ramus]GGK37533.1 hypothetical protein GCM10011322_25720 [Salinarimonas ramus]
MLERLTQTTPPEMRATTEAQGARNAGWVPRLVGSAVLPFYLMLAVLAPLVFFALAAAGDWRAIESDARDRIVYIRDAIAEHAKRVFQTHELVALSVRERIAGMGWPDIAASEDLQGYLAQIERNFDEVHAIWLVDGEGRLRASSREMPAPDLDLSARPWFTTMRETGSGLVVGPRQIGLVHQDDFFTITIPRVEGAVRESFDGLVRISISPEYFTEFYANAYPDEGLIALLLRDGEVLVSYPPEAGIPPRIPETADGLARMSRYSRAVYEGPSAFDEEERIHAFTRLDNLPVYAAFAIDRASLEQAWRSRLAGYVVYFVPAVAALLFLGSLAWRSHRDLEEKVELRTRALSEAVAEKNQLLKEVHHRVKNNMQIVSSLIRMQERVHTSPEETIRRVQAMALVHDLIYSHGEFASVNLGAYVRRLSDTLAGGAPAGTRVAFSHDLDHVAVTLDRAMPFALILSEVLTNALRHAFPDGQGRIAIILDHIDGHAELRVEDDGCGFDSATRADGFGMKLIRSLSVQLEADVRFEEGTGTVFVMRFPIEQTMHPA